MSTCCRKLLLCAICLVGLASGADEQERVLSQLRQHAVALRTLDPSDTDFRDLAAVKQAIGDARVVVLGEASHRDGSAFSAKTRLIKFLHQQMDFDVLVWEWNFYDCYKVNQALEQGEPCAQAVDGMLMSLWRDSVECAELFRYIDATQRSTSPITQAGLASSFTAESPFFEDFEVFLRAADGDLPTPSQQQTLSSVRRFYEGLATHRLPKTESTPPQGAGLDELIQFVGQDPEGQLHRVHSTRDIALMKQALENIESHLEYFHRPLSTGGADDSPIGMQEGRNIVFWAQQFFPQRKLIVWCHNAHLTRNTQLIEDRSRLRFNETRTMGDVAFAELGPQFYSIPVVAHHGQWGFSWNDAREIPAAPPKTLEAQLHASGLKHCFIDLRKLPANHPLRSRQPARPIAYSEMIADWSQVADGLLFIDDMKISQQRAAMQSSK